MYFLVRRIVLLITVIAMEISSVFGAIFSLNKDIVILYTNDIHCAVEANEETGCIGFAGLAAYKKEVEEKTPYITLVDGGDAVQGQAIGTVSKGEYIVDIMNYIGYDYTAIGNHDFDFTMPQLHKMIDKAEYSYLACNITYSGLGENELTGVKSYGIEEYGFRSVAFIGVSTPYSVVSSTPAYFKDENGNRIYGFCEENFYETIQSNIDECKALGADYVVILGHTGSGEDFYPYGAEDIIENVSDIDVYLDAHDHKEIEGQLVKDKDGEDVIMSSTGTGLENIGQLTILPNGEMTTSLISDYTKQDEDTKTFVDSIVESYNTDLKRVVAYNPINLSIYENGIRKIRNREMAIGDLIADAYRNATEAQIALVNGGGIRADLNCGDVTYGDLIAVHPFGNNVVSIKATGQQILDALEMGCRSTQVKYSDGNNAVGECGGFFQVSGIKYTIDTSISSAVVMDANGNFIRVDGERRVKNVKVLNGDTYTDIDPTATYSVSGNNYSMFNGGDGMTMFTGCEKICADGLKDYEVVVSYFLSNSEEFIADNYSSVQNRIIIK